MGFGEIREALRARAETILPEWFPNGSIHGREFHVGNLQGDPGASLRINLDSTLWSDFATQESGRDLIDLYVARHAVKPAEALRRLAHELGFNGSNGARAYLNGGGPTAGTKRANRRREAREERKLGREVAVYEYEGFESVRFDPKDFRQRHRGADGALYWNLGGRDKDGKPRCECHPDGVPLVLFHRQRLIESATRADGKPPKGVLIVEGERDCLTAEEFTFVAVTNPGGAGKWRAEYNEGLRDRLVAVIPDNDDTGRRHGQDVARDLVGIAAKVQIVELPDLPPKGDLTDFVTLRQSQGRTDQEIRDEINALIAAAPIFTPQQAAASAPVVAVAGSDGSHDRGGQATQLVNLALERCLELFHDGDDAYVTVPVASHQETHRIDSRAIRRLLSRWYFDDSGKAPNSESLTAARNVLEARALFEGAQREVYLRVANVGNKIYIDVGNEGWQVIEVTRDKWRVIESKDSPVQFRRTKGTLPFPTPDRGGNIRRLRGFLNLASDADFMLVVAFIVMALRGRGPYPVLLLRAGQGGAKSTQLRVVRRLIDPNSLPLRTWPKEPRDFAIAAENSLALCFDNASSIQQWVSDLLCMAATGGGFAVRTHYENREEELFSFMRPVAITAIRMIIVSPDLEDRAVILDLPRIGDEKRRDEEGFWADFDQAYSELFGVILDGLSMALRNVDAVELERCPRLADFARWACAAMPAFEWTKDDFMSAYTANREDMNTATLESNLIAPFVDVLAPMAPAAKWTGTASELLQLINDKADEATRKKKGWPASPRSLSNALRNIATNLAKVGIEVDFKRDKKRRWIEIGKVPKEFF